jgi:DNA-binding XRE family transcriptional regulator
MARPIKNRDHPLARLRETLSINREGLAKKTGIPLPSLKDIEAGKYKMTPRVATMIAYATGVNPQSLLAGDDPLLDLRLLPFSKDSPRLQPSVWDPEHREAMVQLFQAFLDVAEEKKSMKLFAFLFENWVSETLEAFRIDDTLYRKLTERIPLFDPLHIPRRFRPKTGVDAEQWKLFQDQIKEEESRIYMAARGRRSPRVVLIDRLSEPERVEMHESIDKGREFRAQAREEVARRRKEAKEKDARSKPAAGKRARSPGRPVA